MEEDLCTWLLEQIVEDERTARSAGGRPSHESPPEGERWQWEHAHSDDPRVDTAADLIEEDEHLADGGAVSLRSIQEYPSRSGWLNPLPHFVIHETEQQETRTARHITAWDPVRVLAECEAKRNLVELHRRIWITAGASYFNDAHLTKDPMPVCCSCVPETQFRRATSWPCRSLKAIALPYADRPGYREEWKPGDTP